MSRYDERHERYVLMECGVDGCLGGFPGLSEIRAMHERLDGESVIHPRSYHTWDHVLDVLSALLEAREGGVIEGESFWPYVMAAMFHDAWYDPRAANCENEVRSVELMLQTSRRHGFDCFGSGVGLLPDSIVNSEELILATARHMSDEAEPEYTALFMDADLAGLAAPYPRFVEQNEWVAEEFSGVYTDDELKKGRAQFLRRMLAKGTIFRSDFFGSRLEWRARSNIRRLIRERFS